MFNILFVSDKLSGNTINKLMHSVKKTIIYLLINVKEYYNRTNA